MSKKYIIVGSVLLVLVLVGVGYYYWKSKTQKSATEVAGDVSVGVLPAMDSGAINPLESAQSANPYDKANPFSSIKINPFE
ncbi:MAG: hypothetical protein WC908_00660 [Candidatus Paceibacterota bacterium]